MLPQSQKKHAIVIGGSIAGLAAARVLLKHFDHVTIVERDHYPREPIFRPGVPQGRQLHNTLLRGQQALEQLFPGLTAKLLACGAVERYYGSESLYYYRDVFPRIPPVLHGWNCSRLLLEWQIYRELNVHPQLTIIEGHEVCHLLFEKSSNKVSGIQYYVRNHGPKKNTLQELPADLIVDASGGHSRASQWLKEMGFDAPPEEAVTANLGYATRFYEPHADFKAPWKGIVIQATEHPRRGGSLTEIEEGRWMVVLFGTDGDYPPTEDVAFLEFAKTLPHLALYEAMKSAKPLSKIYGYRYIKNCLHHFEQLAQQPDGFIVVGDAVCNFNPIYGQGMTIAVLEALTLDACLQKRGIHKGFARSFQKKVSRLLVVPWILATAADRRDSHAQTRGFIRNLGRWYVDRLLESLPKDQALFRTSLEILHMRRHPAAIFSPRIMLRVLTKKHWHWMRYKMTAQDNRRPFLS